MRLERAYLLVGYLLGLGAHNMCVTEGLKARVSHTLLVEHSLRGLTVTHPARLLIFIILGGFSPKIDFTSRTILALLFI